MLRGEKVILYEKTQSGVDGFDNPIYTETPVEIDNVLIGMPSNSEILDNLHVYGKKAVFTLGIPKGDNHSWEDVRVDFYGEKWRTFGIPETGNQSLIPLMWGKNVKVERYE